MPRFVRCAPPSFCRPPALGPCRLTRSATRLLYGPDQVSESEVGECHDAVFSLRFSNSTCKNLTLEAVLPAAHTEYSALETRAVVRTLPFEKRGIPAKQDAVLISDWQQQCPRPMVQVKPVTPSVDGGEGAILYCWSWPLDFLFLAPPRAHCIMYCGR